jgi:hypothetical protein
VGFPGLPQDQIRENHVTDPEERTIIEAVCGRYVGMTKIRIRRVNAAAGGARVVELWGANHFVFLSIRGGGCGRDASIRGWIALTEP